MSGSPWRCNLAMPSGFDGACCLPGAAFSLAVAIWTMHFVGMLAARIPFPVDYLVFPTLLSFLVCVLVVGVAVFAISSGPFSVPRLILSACLMGVGIFTMHYIGMTALHASAHMEHAPPLCRGEPGSSPLLHPDWRFGSRPVEVRRPPLILSSVVFGIAVSGMHYTAMAGMTLLRCRCPHRVRRRFRPICWRSSLQWLLSACPAYSCWSSCRIARAGKARR